MICAVIDDGVCITKYPFLSKLAGSVAVTENGVVPAPPPDVCTHGTYCAAIIRLYAPDTEILSVQALAPGSGQGNLQSIRQALAWCAEQPVSVINLSIGSTSLREWPLLRPIIAQLFRKGILLVCAWPNHDRYSVYAGHSWAISVQADNSLHGNQSYIRRGGFFEADFCASSRHTFPISEYKTEGLVSENSHATPVVTAQMCNLLKEQSSTPLEALLRKLEGEEAAKSRFHLRMIPDFLDAAITVGTPIYPENLWFFKNKRKITSGTIHFGQPFSLAVFPERIREKDITALIRQNKDTLRGLLWAGAAPESIKEAAREAGCLFWDESEYQARLANLTEDKSPAEIFRINISGDRQSAIQIAQRLQNGLMDTGIRAVPFSALPQAYCLGMIYLPQRCNAKEVVDALACILDLEIVIYCGDTVDEKCDMNIFCKDGTFLMTYEEYREICHTDAETAHKAVELLV